MLTVNKIINARNSFKKFSFFCVTSNAIEIQFYTGRLNEFFLQVHVQCSCSTNFIYYILYYSIRLDSFPKNNYFSVPINVIWIYNIFLLFMEFFTKIYFHEKKIQKNYFSNWDFILYTLPMKIGEIFTFSLILLFVCVKDAQQ